LTYFPSSPFRGYSANPDERPGHPPALLWLTTAFLLLYVF